MFEEIKQQVGQALLCLLDAAHLTHGDLLVIGCSTSEIAGGVIGKDSTPEAARAVYEAVEPVLSTRGIFLAAQCCEHLNRTLIVEQDYAQSMHLTRVNAVPQQHAGGAFATLCYERFASPVAVNFVQAQAGIDIGDTLIGMHLAPVAVPVRCALKEIGKAHLTMARVRAPFVGGERAHYDPALL